MKKSMPIASSHVAFVRKQAMSSNYLIAFTVDGTLHTWSPGSDGAGHWISHGIIHKIEDFVHLWNTPQYTCFVFPPLEKSFLLDMNYGVVHGWKDHCCLDLKW